MINYMLWANDATRTFLANVQAAMERYQERHGQRPNVIVVKELDWIRADHSGMDTTGLTVVTKRGIQSGHILVGCREG